MKKYIFQLKLLFRYYFFYIKYYSFISVDLPNQHKKNKEIIVVSHELSRTGAPVLLLHIVKELKKRGWSISLVSMSAGPLIEDFAKYSTVYISRTPAPYIKKIEETSGVKKFVLINSVVSGDWCRLFKLKGFRVVSLVHELPGVISSWNALDKAKVMTEYSDLIFFPSSFVQDKFSSIVGKVADYKIFPQGIFLKSDKVFTREESALEVRETFNIDEKPIILNVANGNYRKGFDLFMSLANECPDFNFVWVGEIDKSMLGMYKTKSKSMFGNLYILGYISDIDMLMKIYSASLVLALTSREEPFGSIVLEAMSVGTTVVGFRDAGGFKDVVKNDITGYLVEYESVNEMKNKIIEIASDPILAARLSQNCKDLTLNYSFEKYITRIEKELQDEKY